MSTREASARKEWGRRIGRRVLAALAVMLTVATLAFVALQFLPGDQAESALGGPGSQATQEALDAAREEFGLNRPLPVQYIDFLGRLVRGDLGTSYSQRMPVSAVVGQAIGPTLTLTFAALLMAWTLAFISVVIASGHSRSARGITRALDLTAASLPNFWLASILIILFTSVLPWFPAVSTGRIDGLILPALALALPIAGFIAQVCRTAVDDARHAPFVDSARARGETELGVRIRHVVRHGVVPGLNLTAWALGSLLGGAAVIEVIFARPGLGRTLVNAVTTHDIPVVLGVVLFAAFAYVVVALIVDVLIAQVDPRTEARLEMVTPRA